MADAKQNVGNLVIGMEADASGVKAGVTEARTAVSGFAKSAGDDLKKMTNSTRRASQSFREFGKGAKEGGHEAVTGIQATSSALRTLGGGITNNLRSAERFVASLPGVANALKLAFPVTGAIAVSGIIGELTENVGKFREALEHIQTTPQRIAEGFRAINDPLKKSNDELDKANALLSNDIAMLSGKPKNGLALALIDARIAADDLGSSVRKTIDDIGKLLQTNKTSGIESIIADALMLPTVSGDLSNITIGKNGYGGFKQRINDITGQANAILHPGNTRSFGVTVKGNSGPEVLRRESQQLDSQINQLTQELQQKLFEAKDELRRGVPFSGQHNQTGNIAALQGMLQSLSDLRQNIDKRVENYGLQQQDNSLHFAKDNAKITRNKGPLNYDAISLRAFQVGMVQSAKAAEDWQKHLAQIQKLRQNDGDKISTDLADEQAKRDAILVNLNQQIDAARQLSAAEKQGSDVVWQAQEKLRLTRINDPTIRSLTGQRDAAIHQSQIDGEVTQIQRETAAMKELARVSNLGRDAQRRAAIDRIANSGQDASVIKAQIDALNAQFSLQDAQSGRTLSASEGMHKYFTDMRDSVQSTGQMVEQTLGGAFDSINDTMSRLIEGQKVSWGSFFSGIASQIASMGLRNLEGNLLGGLFGNQQQSKSGTGSAVASGIGGFVKSLFGGFFADGGDVPANRYYVAGEAGPELLWSGSSGAHVMSNKQMRSGNGGAMYYIDARGADAAAVEQRVTRALRQVHGSSVRDAAVVQMEAAKRSPRGWRS